MIRLDVKTEEKEYGTIVNFGKGTVAMNEVLRYTNDKSSGYLTFTEQEPHEINVGSANIEYDSIEEMEIGGQVHFLFENIESIEALINILGKLKNRMED